jgi:ubiquinone/menaquinone biosynthesis C-methylase UbiE
VDSPSGDAYADFAERYDLATGPLDEQAPQAVEFFRRLFAEHGVERVLDCACGSGRHLLLFHSLGCQVSGSDASASMLAQARQNLTAAGIDLPLLEADYRELPRNCAHSFDAVTCLGSIGYMPDETQFLRAFRSMAAVLRPGGVLVLSAIPTDRQWREKPRFLLTANTRNHSRLFVVDYLERRARYNVLDIFHSQEQRGLKVWSAELTVLLRDDQQRLLTTAGFGHVGFFGSFDFQPYDKRTSERLIAVARK